ncbi:MAG: glycosyltransferase [Flavobacteriales bacterium]
MKVSICCITYDHGPYIRRAIEGFLSQRTDFPFEIIIHDDASKDGTAAIVKEYADHDPRIRAILRETNIKSTGVPVFPILYGMARGKYIALCEGDDHWTDPLKLQQQVDALEADPQAVGCFTDAWNERDGMRTSYMDGIYAHPPVSRTVEQREMVMGQNIPTCTFLFRREHLLPLPEAMYKAPVGDTVLYTHLTRNGHLLYLPIHTSVRTMHAGGIHSLKTKLFKLEVQWKLLPILDGMTEGRYTADVQRKITHVALASWAEAVEAGDRHAMRRWWKNVRGRRDAGWNRTTTWRNWMKGHVPHLERLYAMLRGA